MSKGGEGHGRKGQEEEGLLAQQGAASKGAVPSVCPHGQLARVCRVCELEQEVDTLTLIQKSDYANLLDAWRERGEKVPGADRHRVIQRVILGIHELREQRDAAHATIATLRAALAQVEWECLDALAIEEPQCPWCLAYEAEGHTADCARQAALGVGRGGRGSDGNAM